MEENVVELIDYLRVIWKRKRLIVVVTLVGLVVGVGVVINSRSKPIPATTYYASAHIKIGKKVALGSADVHLVPVEDSNILVKIIPLKYEEKVRETLGYHLDVKQVGDSILKLTLVGPEKGVGRVLKEIIDMLIGEHREKSEFSAVAYESFIKKLKADAKMFQENIDILEVSIKEMKIKENNFMEYMNTGEEEIQEEENIGDLSVVWNMLYLKTIDKEIDLSRSRRDLRDIQWQILVYQTTIGSFEDYNTRMSGKIRFKVVTPKGRDTTNTITVAVVAGLIISLSIAFLMEYIEESKSKLKRKGNGKVDLA